MKFFLIILTFLSCAHPNGIFEREKNESHDKKEFYTFEDYSGKYTVTREIKMRPSKLVSRVIILSSAGVELENQVAVSKIGSVKSGKKNRLAILPEASQFKVWYDKEQYESYAVIDKKKRSIEIDIKKPKEKNPQKESYKLPKGSIFCYYSQIPECLKMQNLLVSSAKKPLSFYIIWDSYPFHTEQFQGVSSEPVVMAKLSLSKYDNNEFKFIVDIGNQVIFYHYDKSLNFIKMFWISQGISLVKQLGE